MSGNVSMNGGHAGPSRPPPLAPRPLAASASPAQVESPPVNGKRKPPGKSGFSKGKKKEEQSGSDSDELGEDGHPRKRARNRMALSCSESCLSIRSLRERTNQMLTDIFRTVRGM